MRNSEGETGENCSLNRGQPAHSPVSRCDPVEQRYIVVLGCYRSGSSCLSGVLSRLGVQFGVCVRPHAHNPLGYFEHAEARAGLIRLYDQARGQSRISDQEFGGVLKAWRESLRQLKCPVAGLKHPLLCCLGPQLESVFASDRVQYVAIYRPEEEIVASMVRCRWRWTRNADIPAAVRRLCEAREQFLAHRSHLRVQFHQLLDDTVTVVESLAAFADLDSSRLRRLDACQFVRRSLAHR